MRGKLYGIGTGPGDSELLTLKAVSTMESCDVIAVPNGGGEGKTAYSIVEKYIAHKELMQCSFSMDKCEETRIKSRQKVADDIAAVLEQGKNIGFITLGEPTIYSTYMYIHKLVSLKGFETEIIPGIPSFVAAAAALNTSLCEGGELLHIIPGSRRAYEDNGDMDEILDLPGNKIIMKSGKSLNDVLDVLEQRGLSEKTQIVERCGMDGQRIFNSISEYKAVGDASYFSIAIVKG